MTSAQSKHGGAKVRFPPPFVLLGLIVIGVALQRWVRPLELPLPQWPRVIGGAAIALGGVLLLVAANRWFARTGQSPAPWKPSPELIIQGVYRYTRNPMYVGFILFQVGLGIALDNGWLLVFSPIGLAILHFIAVRPEEAYLTEKFGDSYLRYMSAVRRYL